MEVDLLALLRPDLPEVLDNPSPVTGIRQRPTQSGRHLLAGLDDIHYFTELCQSLLPEVRASSDRAANGRQFES